MELNASKHGMKSAAKRGFIEHHAHGRRIRKRFRISLVVILPILVLSPMLQTPLRMPEAIRFPGDLYVPVGLTGKMFFWELATLGDIMLLGHWIETKSALGASMVLEELAGILPFGAHKLTPGGSVKDALRKALAPA